MATEVEFGGVKFTGGKMFALLTALSTLGGATWGGFEIYKDYMDMKEIIQNIDTTEIENRNKIIEQKLNDAIEYTRDIKSGLRDDILGIEKQADRVEDMVRASEEKVRQQIQMAEERFENKRDALQNEYDKKATALRSEYDQKAGALRDTTDQKIQDAEDRLNKKLQRALDNPLAN